MVEFTEALDLLYQAANDDLAEYRGERARGSASASNALPPSGCFARSSVGSSKSSLISNAVEYARPFSREARASQIALQERMDRAYAGCPSGQFHQDLFDSAIEGG